MWQSITELSMLPPCWDTSIRDTSELFDSRYGRWFPQNSLLIGGDGMSREGDDNGDGHYEEGENGDQLRQKSDTLKSRQSRPTVRSLSRFGAANLLYLSFERAGRGGSRTNHENSSHAGPMHRVEASTRHAANLMARTPWLPNSSRPILSLAIGFLSAAGSGSLQFSDVFVTPWETPDFTDSDLLDDFRFRGL